MKKIFLTAGIAFFLSMNAWADNKPSACPSVAAIKKIGLSGNIIQDNDGKWYAGRTSQNYETKEKWTFVIGGITAANKVDAMKKAKDALATLCYRSGPKKAPANKWLCLYDNNKHYLSGAVTPPIDDFDGMKYYN